MKPRYLFPSDYMADPSANVFNGRIYVYPSHDWDAGECFDDDGGHFQMKDYHVLSWDDIENGEVTDHGVILDVKDVPWAEKQMWDNDVVEKDGKYYPSLPRNTVVCSVLVLLWQTSPKVRSFLRSSLSVDRSLLTLVCSRMTMDKSTATSVDSGVDSCSGAARSITALRLFLASMVTITVSSTSVRLPTIRHSSSQNQMHPHCPAMWYA